MNGIGATGSAVPAGAAPVVFATTGMKGWWSKAFFMSWDSRHVLVPQLTKFFMTDGKGQAVEHEWYFHGGFRNVMWGPDNRHFIAWKGPSPDKAQGGSGEGSGVAVLDANDLGEACTEAKHVLVYPKTDRRQPTGAGWSPRGDAVICVAQVLKKAQRPGPDGKPFEVTVRDGTIIERVSPGGGAPQELFRDPGGTLYAWAPWTRYEDGSGPSERPYQILVRTENGLWIMDPDGGNKEKVSESRLTSDVVWNPGPGNQVALLYSMEEASKTGERLRGVYLCDLDKRVKGKPLPLEQLTPDLDIDTIWFSPRGKFFVWQSATTVFYRAPGGKPDSKVKVELPGVGKLLVKGCIWNAREDKLAVVAGTHVFVHDVATGKTAEVAQLGEDAKAFGADPQWQGDDLIVGTYTTVGPAAVDSTHAEKKPGPP